MASATAGHPDPTGREISFVALSGEQILGRARQRAEQAAVLVLLALRFGRDPSEFFQQIMQWSEFLTQVVHSDLTAIRARMRFGQFSTILRGPGLRRHARRATAGRRGKSCKSRSERGSHEHRGTTTHRRPRRRSRRRSGLTAMSSITVAFGFDLPPRANDRERRVQVFPTYDGIDVAGFTCSALAPLPGPIARMKMHQATWGRSGFTRRVH
jgi:hypothetical protein